MIEAPFLNSQQIEVLRKLYSPDPVPSGLKPDQYLTATEFAHFIEVVQRRKLDPFVRQIYWTKRSTKDDDGQYVARVQVEAQIDGLRLIAERTGKYAGQLGPFWYDAAGEMGQPGRWVDVWLGAGPPLAAKVGVLRTDFKEPLWGVANWIAYAQYKRDNTLNRMWERMGPHMLAKCAESLGLHKAFPEDLSGLTIAEESAGVDRLSGKNDPNSDATPLLPPSAAAPPESSKGTAPDEQGEVLTLQQWRDKVRAEQKRQSIPDPMMKKLAAGYTGKRTTHEMMIPDLQKLFNALVADEEKIRNEQAAAAADAAAKPAGAGK